MSGQVQGPRVPFHKAVSEALKWEMENDENVFVMGEDVGALGSIFQTTAGLHQQFGEERVRDTPISESGFVSAAVGAAMSGMKPVVELMFNDFIGVCLDPLYNMAAKNAYHSGGGQAVPLVMMTSVGGGYCDGSQHSQSLYATFCHMPGMKVVAPSNAYDARGLMHAAIEDPNPVIYMFHKMLVGLGWYGSVKMASIPVPNERFTVPIGKAQVKREGTDITLVGWGVTLHYALQAAESLSGSGISAEVIDLRSLVPLDMETIMASLEKTGRLIVVDEDYKNCGVAGEVLARISESNLSVLRSSPRRICFPDIPIPFARPMEQFARPSAEKIVETAIAMLETAK